MTSLAIPVMKISLWVRDVQEGLRTANLADPIAHVIALEVF